MLFGSGQSHHLDRARKPGRAWHPGRAHQMMLYLSAAVVCGLVLTGPTASAQSIANEATKAAAAGDAAGVRMKPLSRTAKPVAADDQVSAVTTGSVAKMAGAVGAPAPASKTAGRCTRLAFEVNDYGKDGPTKDAKSLLDKHIATWAAEKGIKKYTVGKKVVNCRLFLDLIVFDEHTCRAEAPVCW